MPEPKSPETTEMGKNIAQSEMGMFDGLIPDSRKEELINKISEQVKNAPEPVVATDTTAATAPVPPVVPPDTSNLDALKKTTFFSDIVTPPITPIEIKDWDAAAKYLSENTGTEIKDYSDIQKITSEYKTLKDNSSKITDYEKQINRFESVFATMPDELFGAMQKYLNKEDYRSFLKEQLQDTIDFNIPFEKQDKKEMLNHYFPGKFSAEDYEEEEDDNGKVKPNPKVLFATEEASKKYATDKKTVENNRISYRDKYDKEQKASTEKLRTSAISSWNNFTQGKNIENSRKEKIGTLMEGGYNFLYELFFDKEGGYQPDAAEKLSLLLYAKDDIEVAKKIISERVKSATMEEMVSRGNDHPASSGGSRGTSELTPEQAAKKIVEQQLQ